MILSMESQVILFLTTIAAGFAIGFIYDIFRVIRLIFKHPDFLLHIEDILYWLFVAFLMFYIMLFQNYGEIRFFSIIGAFIGMALYFLTISKLFMGVSKAIVEFVKKIVLGLIYVILFPFKILFKIIMVPYQAIKKIIKKVLQKSNRYAKIRIRKIFGEFKIILKKH